MKFSHFVRSAECDQIFSHSQVLLWKLLSVALMLHNIPSLRSWQSYDLTNQLEKPSHAESVQTLYIWIWHDRDGKLLHIFHTMLRLVWRCRFWPTGCECAKELSLSTPQPKRYSLIYFTPFTMSDILNMTFTVVSFLFVMVWKQSDYWYTITRLLYARYYMTNMDIVYAKTVLASIGAIYIIIHVKILHSQLGDI